jgi:hypothetical protein
VRHSPAGSIRQTLRGPTGGPRADGDLTPEPPGRRAARPGRARGRRVRPHGWSSGSPTTGAPAARNPASATAVDAVERVTVSAADQDWPESGVGVRRRTPSTRSTSSSAPKPTVDGRAIVTKPGSPSGGKPGSATKTYVKQHQILRLHWQLRPAHSTSSMAPSTPEAVGGGARLLQRVLPRESSSGPHSRHD